MSHKVRIESHRYTDFEVDDKYFDLNCTHNDADDELCRYSDYHSNHYEFIMRDMNRNGKIIGKYISDTNNNFIKFGF